MKIVGRKTLLIALLLGWCVSMAHAASCPGKLLSSADVDRLILQTPEANAARSAGLHPRVTASGHMPYAGNHPSITRLLTADRGGALNNGILDYLTVDRVTGDIFDVNGDVVRNRALEENARRLLARCK